jgi:single-strand DNA-binding protein
MIQIVSLIGEVVSRNDKGNLIVNVHTHYVTPENLVVKDAYVILSPTKYVNGPKFEKPDKGNLIYAQGRFKANDFGSPFISPEGEGVFYMAADELNLLARVADEERDSDHFEIVLVGNLGRDPETRYTATGKEFTTASIATNHKSADEEYTTWFKLAAWITTKLGQMKKGGRLFAVGSPRFDEQTGGPLVWQTQAGEDRSNYEINIRRLIPLEKVEQQAQSHYDEPEIPF